MDLLYTLPGLFIAIIFHELAHGYVAYLLGDNTAKNAGRLTLNPIRHIDPIGFISMLVFKFGWAKAVPVNSSNFNNRKIGMLLVSIAGPAANFILAILFGFVLISGIITNNVIQDIVIITIWYNIMLGVFNLLPFPPLDGSKIVASILPKKIEFYFYKYEKYLYVILLTLVFTGSINKIMEPLINLAFNTLIKILSV